MRITDHKCPLEFCDSSGLLPFVLPDGTISRYAKIFCQCRQEHEYQPRLRPEDIDFSVNYSVYRSLCREHGWPDPGSDIEVTQQVSTAGRTLASESQPWQQDQWQSVQQLKAMNLHLDKQVKELLVRKKRETAKPKLPVQPKQPLEENGRVDITTKLYPSA